jgi:hypothetical protein
MPTALVVYSQYPGRTSVAEAWAWEGDDGAASRIAPARAGAATATVRIKREGRVIVDLILGTVPIL